MTNVWEDFLNWVYDYFVQKSNKSLLWFQKLTGKRNTILDAWLYFGGKFEQRKVSLPVVRCLPEQAEAYARFASTPANHRHYVTCNIGSVIVRHEKETYNFVDEIFSLQLTGRKIVVVVDKNTREGYVFIPTANPNEFLFLKKVRDHTIRSSCDLELRTHTNTTRKNIMREINAQTIEAQKTQKQLQKHLPKNQEIPTHTRNNLCLIKSGDFDPEVF